MSQLKSLNAKIEAKVTERLRDINHSFGQLHETLNGIRFNAVVASKAANLRNDTKADELVTELAQNFNKERVEVLSGKYPTMTGFEIPYRAGVLLEAAHDARHDLRTLLDHTKSQNVSGFDKVEMQKLDQLTHQLNVHITQIDTRYNLLAHDRKNIDKLADMQKSQKQKPHEIAANKFSAMKQAVADKIKKPSTDQKSEKRTLQGHSF